MNLIERIAERSIGGLQENEYRAILSGEGSHTIRNRSKGIILLDDGNVINCVAQYYQPLDGRVLRFGGNSTSCHQIQKELGIPGNVFDCVPCHRMCFDMYREGHIKRRIKRKRR